MRFTAFFPHLTGFRLDAIHRSDGQLTLTATAVRKAAPCPICHRRSRRVHSRYHRRVADLPLGGTPLTLVLHVRKFFCRNPRCPRRIFAERLPSLVAAGARRSLPLHAVLERVAFTLGGEAGARLAIALGMPTTPDILLRLIRAAPLPAIGTPEHVGVDDFALRKGRVYAGLIIDHDQHRPLDVLPDCSPTTIAAWLAAHPSIRLVSRDRGTPIVEGVTRGAPQAIQVADRWHLLKNLGEALERLLVRQRTEWHDALLTEPPEQPVSERVIPASGESDTLRTPRAPTPRAIQAAQERQARQDRRVARYEEARRLSAQGWSLRAIAREMHLNRHTVQDYLASDIAPILRPRARKPSKLDPYREYIHRRWEEGCHDAAVLLAELRRRGYTGGHSILRAYVAPLRQAPTCGTGEAGETTRVRPAARATWSSRQLVALFLHRPEALTSKQARTLDLLRAASPLLASVHDVVQVFAVMVRERKVEGLTEWVEAMRRSEERELRGFAEGLLEDYAAVRAGLTLPESNGPTEGHINRLKLVKRAMYGRGKVDLLRQRVVWRG
jgi:transposase